MNVQNQMHVNMSDQTVVENRVIYETTNYDMFHYIDGNRELDWNHVHKLAERMEQEGQKDPIEVTPDFGISDGQHRFEGCKEKGLPVRWTYGKEKTVEDIQKKNMDRKDWDDVDYMKSFAKQGSKSTARTLSLMSEFKVSRTIAVIAGGKDKALFSKNFFKGNLTRKNQRDPMDDNTFSQEDYEAAREHIMFAREMVEILDKFEKVRQRSKVMEVFIKLDKAEGVDRDRIRTILKTNGDQIPISSTSQKAIITKIAKLYNHRRRKGFLMDITFASDGRIKTITCTATENRWQ